jgi:hypothetical protein
MSMALFNQKINLVEILREIPEKELTRLSQTSKVDYCSKVLNGKLMFYLLLYGILKIDGLSQRGLSDAFSSPFFRTIFHYDNKKKTVSHSSISERLSLIEVDFFREVYECFYKRLSFLYTKKEIAGMRLERVDSTLVAESSDKLREGLSCGNEYKKGKMLKYTVNFDGMFASLGKVHKEDAYASESLALPENVLHHFKKEQDHARVYIFDRGQASAEAFKEMKGEDQLLFVGRLNENRKLKTVKEFNIQDIDFKYGELTREKGNGCQ